MADIRAKALSYLRDGKVTISAATFAGTNRAPYDVLAYVDGHTGTRIIRYGSGEWGCSCRKQGCAHVAAVQLVTGHTSAAGKPQAVSA